MTGRLVYLGKTLQSRIREFFDSPIDGAATPLEVLHGALETLERKVQPVGRGRRVFPYNRVTIRVGPAVADKASLQAAFEDFDGKLRERLAELKCTPPPGLLVRMVFVKRAPADWTAAEVFRVECGVDAESAEVAGIPPAQQPAIEVSVVKGAATQPTYTFTQPIVCIGRTEDPIDIRGNVRRNHVVFGDTIDGITETVGRAHARIEFDAEHREYRILNEGSSNPTFISRAGTTIQVQRDPRGVRVRSGDEIQLGRALVRIAVVAAPIAPAAATNDQPLPTSNVAG